MSEIADFSKYRTLRRRIPTLVEVTAHPSRSSTTPATQSGQPAFLFTLPEGQTFLRTTQLGYRALHLAQESGGHVPLELSWDETAGEINYLTADNEDLNFQELFLLQEELSKWLVLHSYKGVSEITNNSYERSFQRMGIEPPSAPHLSYTWLVDFGEHGGTWAFGTSRDLTKAKESIKNNDFIQIEEENFNEMGALTCFSLSGSSSAHIKYAFESIDYWVKREIFTCECCP